MTAPAVVLTPVRPGFGPVLRAYVGLTKPRIIELLLITTVPPMILAAHERSDSLPSLWLVLATMLGGTLAAASANTINCYVDRDIDAVMHRTSRRTLVQRSVVVSPLNALRFGIVLSVLATAWLGLVVNWPAALLADAATLVYVFIYTLLLKRRTPANIVIGGAAGCFPVFVGWAAVTGGLGWPAVVLFMVVFLWTPPHFWALAIRYKDDYAAAGVPDAAGGRHPAGGRPAHHGVQLADGRGVIAAGPAVRRRLALRRGGSPQRCAVPRRGAPVAALHP